MDDYYHQFLSSMSGAGSHPPPDDLQSSPIQGGQIPGLPTSLANTYQNPEYMPGFTDQVVYKSAKHPKGRRKSAAGLAPGVDHVKHRRTRSGCYMCRSRRVKCDETRPICERCRKGNRECVYPDPPAPKGGSGQGSRTGDPNNVSQQTSPLSSAEGDEDPDKEASLEPIRDEEEPEDHDQHSLPSRASHRRGTDISKSQYLVGRHGSETPSQEDNKSSSPASSAATTGGFISPINQTSDFPPVSAAQLDWTNLPWEYQSHLEWFSTHITHYHYSMVQDKDRFFTKMLVSYAIRNEALLNALVGFAAYHRTLQNPNGKLEDFLHYYNKSVTMLLGFLKRKEKHDVTTLLTILQLATIEEYLGDWVNLMGHQKAAFEILAKMFSPRSVMQSAIGRGCLMWYYRFDNFVALMGGFPTELPREWYDAMLAFSQSQVAANPDSTEWKVESLKAIMRRITYDMSIVYARRSRGQLSPEQFAEEHSKISERLMEWKEGVDPSLVDPKHLVTEFSQQKPLAPDHIFDPYRPGVLFDFPLFTSNILMVEWLSVIIMHKSQAPSEVLRASFMELGTHAYEVCQYFETLQHWKSTPSGVLIAIQPALSIAALFLPQDSRHHMWLRRKFARLEIEGYIYPSSIRQKMALLFRDPSCENWWLPDENGFTPVLRSIRNFAEERNAAAVTSQQESLREIRHIFASLELK
jgi:hypothetical protein